MKSYKGSALKKQKPKKPEPDLSSRTCGCTAGVFVNAETLRVERCDDCALFETDEDAVNAVEHLLKLLHSEYERGTDTVADAADRLASYVEHGRDTFRAFEAAWSSRAYSPRKPKARP